MEIIFTIIGTLITFVSFGYAIYANKKHSKLVNYNREQAWEIYRQSTAVLAAYQKLEKMNIGDKEAVALIAKAEAHANELTFNSIKMIKRFEKKYTKETIKKWAEEGKLDSHESHIKAFQNLVET
ncbi:MAG: hypothetical protein PHI86_03115 [Candidatus Omnitrophica bacterium]|nr:hypothetical protein [Candidatus Omnitrophota bacterium]HOX53980.1 hypothetical protein [Candidatus Omnitrophota bacterium]